MEVMTPRPAQPTPGSGPPDSTQRMPREPDLEHVLELEVLHRAGRGGQAEDGVLSLGVEDEAGGVGLRVAADDEDLLPELDERGEGVLGGRGLPDPSFTVKCDLTQLSHCRCPVVRQLVVRFCGLAAPRAASPAGPALARPVAWVVPRDFALEIEPEPAFAAAGRRCGEPYKRYIRLSPLVEASVGSTLVAVSDLPAFASRSREGGPIGATSGLGTSVAVAMLEGTGHAPRQEPAGDQERRKQASHAKPRQLHLRRVTRGRRGRPRHPLSGVRSIAPRRFSRAWCPRPSASTTARCETASRRRRRLRSRREGRHRPRPRGCRRRRDRGGHSGDGSGRD